ncbi:hypothetical protein RFI_01003, partial [Reticulomyxa filosa]
KQKEPGDDKPFPKHVVVYGPPGAGKSHLVAYYLGVHQKESLAYLMISFDADTRLQQNCDNKDFKLQLLVRIYFERYIKAGRMDDSKEEKKKEDCASPRRTAFEKFYSRFLDKFHEEKRDVGNVLEQIRQEEQKECMLLVCDDIGQWKEQEVLLHIVNYFTEFCKFVDNHVLTGKKMIAIHTTTSISKFNKEENAILVNYVCLEEFIMKKYSNMESNRGLQLLMKWCKGFTPAYAVLIGMLSDGKSKLEKISNQQSLVDCIRDFKRKLKQDPVMRTLYELLMKHHEAIWYQYVFLHQSNEDQTDKFVEMGIITVSQDDNQKKVAIPFALLVMIDKADNDKPFINALSDINNANEHASPLSFELLVAALFQLRCEANKGKQVEFTKLIPILNSSTEFKGLIIDMSKKIEVGKYEKSFEEIIEKLGVYGIFMCKDDNPALDIVVRLPCYYNGERRIFWGLFEVKKLKTKIAITYHPKTWSFVPVKVGNLLIFTRSNDILKAVNQNKSSRKGSCEQRLVNQQSKAIKLFLKIKFKELNIVVYAAVVRNTLSCNRVYVHNLFGGFSPNFKDLWHWTPIGKHQHFFVENSFILLFFLLCSFKFDKIRQDFHNICWRECSFYCYLCVFPTENCLYFL